MLRRPCIKFRPQFLNLCIFNFCFPWNLPLCTSKDVLCRESNIHRISALFLCKWLSGSSTCSFPCQKPRKYMALLLLGISWSTVWRYKMFKGIRILLIKNKKRIACWCSWSDFLDSCSLYQKNDLAESLENQLKVIFLEYKNNI